MTQLEACQDRVTMRHASRAPRWLDVSVPLRTGMVHWPGDPEIRVGRVKELSRGDEYTLSAVSMGAHSGTHMDAPSHFLNGAPDLDSLSLEATVGRARVLAIPVPSGVLTGGGPGNATTLLSIDLVKIALGQFDLGPAAAMSLIYFLIILLLSWVFYTVMTRDEAN